AVISTYIYVTVARRERRDIPGWQAGGDCRPAVYPAVTYIQAAVERSGINVAFGDEHGIGVDHERVARLRKAVPLPHRIQPQDTRTIRSGKPIVAGPGQRRNPVVLQPRVRRCVGGLNHTVFEYGQPA